MQISFTGIKNIAYESKKEYVNEDTNRFVDIINAQLTDDKYGKDLSEYKKVLNNVRERSGKKSVNFKHPEDDCAINIKYEHFGNDKNKKLYVNGIPLDNEKITDIALPLIIFANKLTDKIKNLTYDTMVVKKDYLDSYEADNGIWLGEQFPRISDCFFCRNDDYKTYMENLFDKKDVKKGNNYIGKVITQFLSDFLISSPKIKETAEEISLDGGFKRFT